MRKFVLPICTVVVLVVCLGVLATDYLAARTQHIVRTALLEVLDHDAQDIKRQMECVAREQSALFVLEHMPKVAAFGDKFALLEHSLRSVDPKLNGLYCEFGVFTGETINHIASKTPHTIHGFDSFEGLPEAWRTGFDKGAFAMSGLPKVRENVELHKGWFDQSLPVWAAAHPGPIAFLHMDADLYSSTKTVLDILGDRIVPGTVIQFDEYFNYPGWQQGEWKAFDEFVAARQVQFEYLGFCDKHEQVAMKILSIGGK
jgi:hypothetical protein